MGAEAITWAWQQRPAKSSQKMILLSMADRAGEDFTCWPSIQRLVNDTLLNRKTVMSSLKSLVEQGFISDTGQRKGHTKSVVVYQLNGVKGRSEMPQTEANNTCLNKQSQNRNSSENGTAKQSQNRDTLEPKQAQNRDCIEGEAVPILPISSTNFTHKQSQNRDTEPNKEPKKELRTKKTSKKDLLVFPEWVSPDQISDQSEYYTLLENQILLVPKKIKGQTKTQLRNDRTGFVQLPDWLNRDKFLEYVKTRGEWSKPCSQKSIEDLINTLWKLIQQGQNQFAVVEQALIREWESFHPVRETHAVQHQQKPNNPSFVETCTDQSWATGLSK